MSTREEREAEVAALVVRALDPEDPYDGHHGDDRSDAAFALAEVIDPAVAERIRNARGDVS